MVRIVVADDHYVVREGMRQIVSDEPDMEIVGEARNAEELLALISRQPCDVVVLDISMPGRSGLEVLPDLKRQRPELAVLVLTIHPEEQYALQAFRMGAAGYLTKESVGEELLGAIRTVTAGDRYVSPSLVQRWALLLGTEAARPLHETLTDREYQVMCLIGSGLSTKEIAARLSRNVRTIDACRARILEKMNMNNVSQLIRYAIENRLVS